MKIGDVDVVEVGKETFKEFREDDIPTQAAAVAYNLLFSIVPLLIFLTALGGFISRAVGADDAIDDITEWVRDRLPSSSEQAVITPIEEVVRTQAGGLLSVGALLALWGARNAVQSVMKALNTAYGVEEARPWWRRQLVSMGLVIGLGLVLALSSFAFLAGSTIGEDVADRAGVESTWVQVWNLARWPLIVILVIVGLAVFYWAAPATHIPFRWVSPGSVLTVILWGVASVALGFYFSTFAGYTESAYGALGGLLAFIFWVYVMNMILLIGGELNAVLAKRAATAVDETGAEVLAHPERFETRPSAAEMLATVTLPSQAEAIHQQIANESAPAQANRAQKALSTLGVATVAAGSGLLASWRQRKRRIR